MFRLISPNVVRYPDQVLNINQGIVRVKCSKIYVNFQDCDGTDIVFEYFTKRGYLTWLSPLEENKWYPMPSLRAGGHLLLALTDKFGTPLKTVYITFLDQMR